MTDEKFEARKRKTINLLYNKRDANLLVFVGFFIIVMIYINILKLQDNLVGSMMLGACLVFIPVSFFDCKKRADLYNNGKIDFYSSEVFFFITFVLYAIHGLLLITNNFKYFNPCIIHMEEFIALSGIWHKGSQGGEVIFDINLKIAFFVIMFLGLLEFVLCNF